MKILSIFFAWAMVFYIATTTTLTTPTTPKIKRRGKKRSDPSSK